MTEKSESTRDQTLQDFRQLLVERERAASRITTKEQAAERAKDKEVVQAASVLTVEGIVRGLADLQLTFDRAAEELGQTLILEAAKLDQVRRAIEIETAHLQELEQIKTAANALDILVQEQQEQARTSGEWSAQQREALEREIAAQRADWQEEQEKHVRVVAEYEESLRRERSQAEADFDYDLERKRKIEMDEYEARRRRQEREIVEAEAEKRADWSERERAIAECQQELEEYRARVAVFPQELEKAIAEASDEAFEAATREAEVSADLFKKEIEANARVRELQIQALESTIARQAERIENLSADLKEALTRAQDLATKAVAGTAADDPSLAR